MDVPKVPLGLGNSPSRFDPIYIFINLFILRAYTLFLLIGLSGSVEILCGKRHPFSPYEPQYIRSKYHAFRNPFSDMNNTYLFFPEQGNYPLFFFQS